MLQQIDFDWQKITDALVDEFGVYTISCMCELSIKAINQIRSGLTLEPTYSAGCLIRAMYEHYFPKTS